MAEFLGVSKQAMAIRLKRLGLLKKESNAVLDHSICGMQVSQNLMRCFMGYGEMIPVFSTIISTCPGLRASVSITLTPKFWLVGFAVLTLTTSICQRMG